jgi:transposase
LAPTPWQSGQIDREQGVSKAGNPRLRVALIQLSDKSRLPTLVSKIIADARKEFEQGEVARQRRSP